MARRLHGGPDLRPEGGDAAIAAALQAKVDASLTHNDARAKALGLAGGTLASAYEGELPADAGPPAVLSQPRSIERFATAKLTWLGGSNFTDDPRVVVERRAADGGWERFADQSGEVVTTLRFPAGQAAEGFFKSGRRWEWTATWEAFVAQVDGGDRPLATPAGEYRFVVEGRHRSGSPAAAHGYRLASRAFEVKPWSGITAEDLRLEGDHRVSLRVGPRHVFDVNAFEDEAGPQPPLTAEVGPIDYPDSSPSPVKFIVDRRTAIRDPDHPLDPARVEWYCFDCSFRPWLDAGYADSVHFTFSVGGVLRRVAAREVDGRWVSASQLGKGGSAWVCPGDVVDSWGNLNGAASAVVGTAVDPRC
jgi:hypothetical protein